MKPNVFIFVWSVLGCSLYWHVAIVGDETTPSVRTDSVRALQVTPAEIHLGGANRRQQLLITAGADSGRHFDVTHHARLEIEDHGVAKLVGTVIDGVRDGTTHLRIRVGAADLRVQVVVEGYDRYPPLQFISDVVPLFSKLGCNSGGCHGKSSGQNGFRLSVFGFDPQADYSALTKEARGRRIFPGDPARSLLVRKAIGQVPHGGGQRTEPNSIDHEMLTEWVRQGSPWGDHNAKSATIANVRFEPANRVMEPGADQQILVTAVFSDGSQRDVTAAAAYSVNAENIARVDHDGHVQVGTTPGEAAVTVNYMGHVGTVQLLVPRLSTPDPYPQTAVQNEIDRLVYAKLEKLGLVPSELCDDPTFLRRLFVDAIGTLPTANEVRSFLADTDPSKRSRMIDRVLKRDEFVDYWTLKWADVLMVDRKALGDRGAYAFHGWLREQIRCDRPYDQWVRELICASGNSAKNGAVNFYRAARSSEDLARAVSQAFLGVRIDCAQCHHHPYDRWGQEDFVGLAGFFQGLVRTKLAGDREFVFHGGYQASILPRTGKSVAARPLGSDSPAGVEDGDPRVKLADWITSPSNPWFARLVSNRLWKHFLGRGLVEPEDDLRSSNPATNEPLLAYLAEQVVTQKYDLKGVMRLILNSRVYQHSRQTNVTNRDDEQNFSHHFVRRIPVEVLLDAVSEVTGSPEDFPGLPPGTRAIQVWDNRLPSYFLDTFGRSHRESPCACGASGEPTMSQALHLMNAPEIEEKIASKTGRVARLVNAGQTPDQIIDELCLTACGSPPTKRQRQVAAELFAKHSPIDAAEDFLWTLLNSYEFLFVY
jgi:hypothetical protein